MAFDITSELRASGPIDPDDRLVVELVLPVSERAEAVAARLEDLLGKEPLAVESAFGTQAPDRFHFATFTQFQSRGREAACFAFARELGAALGAVEATPVLIDSLSGGAVVADNEETLSAVCESPRDDSLARGWVHQLTKVREAWAANRGEGVVIGLIDTGYSDHVELNGVVVPDGQLNLVEGGLDARDRFSGGWFRQPGHGTLVMSVVASRGGVDEAGATSPPGEVTGVAPAAAILPIRAIKSVISFRQTTIPRAIRHAVAQGCDVIAMALGGPTRVSSVEKALREAVAAGVVVICAAGNCWPRVVFPAAYAREGLCCAVAAVRHTLEPWARTGRGSAVTIAAPGENVWGASISAADGDLSEVAAAQGTTLATSVTTGIAALWVARHGGGATLREEAAARGTTVQAMFLDAITHGIEKPAVWEGATDMGAGVVDAQKALAAPLPAHREAPVAAVDTERVLPTVSYLREALAETERADAIDPELAPFAAEILWLAYRNGARLRAARSLGQESVVAMQERPSSETEAVLSGRPDIRAFAQAGGVGA